MTSLTFGEEDGVKVVGPHSRKGEPLKPRTGWWWCVLAVAVGCSDHDVRPVATEQHPLEFWPLWSTSYRPLNVARGQPPWPLGPTATQRDVLSGFDRAWIAALEPTPTTQSPYQFHGHRVRGFRELRLDSEKEPLQQALAACFDAHRDGWPAEGSPGIGLRLQKGERVVDLLVERKQHLVFLFDEDDLTILWIPDDGALLTVLKRATARLPVDPAAD
jgi:hypothetical protein